MKPDALIEIRATHTFDRIIAKHMHDIELEPVHEGQPDPALNDEGGAWVFAVVEVRVRESAGRPRYEIYSAGRVQGVHYALFINYQLDNHGQPTEPRYCFSHIPTTREG